MPFCDKSSYACRLKSHLWYWLVLVLVAVQSTLADGRLNLNFDPGWKFIKADPADAFQPGFDDHDWAAVSLPHTYNDTDTFENFSLSGHRGEQNQWGGRTWYRKTFSLPA